jgi:phenylpropionate dioxygenase-like ring-hydroxylating dioxygenase large terminal subunit
MTLEPRQADTLFRDFARIWTPVAYSTQLRAERPLRVQVAGTRVVLFRDPLGAPAALLDRCPHRGVALSLGTVTGGCLQCPFHGWRFDRSGRCLSVPWNPQAPRTQLAALAIPAHELAGQIWIYTSPADPVPAAPTVDARLAGPDTRLTGIEMTWNTHWTRAMENMLDWPHLPFVHRRSIGKDLVPLIEQPMDTLIEEHEWGWRVRTALHGRPRPGLLDFRKPNQMNLHIPMRQRTLILAVSCVPLDEQRTRLLLMTARDFARPAILDGFFNRANRRIANEDRAIVESSDPPEIPRARAERSVRTDKATLRFRAYYFNELKGSLCQSERAAR